MRYINISKIEDLLSKEQKDALLSAAQMVKDLVQKDGESVEDFKKRRIDIINNHSFLWANVKGIYEKFFGCKCWYSESKNPGSSKDMDHFRPKAEVFEDDSHPGYWWLAFDWENYRYSCQFSNRLKKNPETAITGGKGSHFPLFENGSKACRPTDDHKSENHVLLDPCVAGDFRLLSFEENGKPIIHPKFNGDSDSERRVRESIKYMNLDYPAFNEERGLLYKEIKEIIENADREYKLYAQDKGRNQALLATFRSRIAELEKKRDLKAPYSRAAEIFIGYFRNKPWVEQFLFP